MRPRARRRSTCRPMRSMPSSSTGSSTTSPSWPPLMQHPRWREGRLSTGFIAEEFKGGFKPRAPAGRGARHPGGRGDRHRPPGQRAPPRDHRSDGRAGGALLPPAASPTSAARWSRRGWKARSGSPAKVTLVDAKGIRRTTLDVDADWWPGNPLWRGHVGKRRVAVQVRPILNGYELAYRGIRAKAYVYTEREADAGRPDAGEGRARHLQAAALPDAGPGQGDPRVARARR